MQWSCTLFKSQKTLDFSQGFITESRAPESTALQKTLNKKDNFDPLNDIEEILKNPNKFVHDSVVDDRDVKQAPNFIEFVLNKRYLGATLFAKQMQMGIELFGEYNPLESDVDWLQNMPIDATLDEIRDRVQLLEWGVCPKTGVTKSELINQGLITPYRELAALVGQRSGKSYFTCYASLYVIHGFMKLGRGKTVLKLPKDDLLIGTLVAITYQQARETLYDRMFSMVSNSQWFSEYHELLDYYGKRRGEEIYKFKDTFLLYRNSNLFIYPSGPDMRTLRGRTRFLGAIDEIGWLNASSPGSVKYNANSIYDAMNRSFTNVRDGWMKAMAGGRYPQLLPPMFFNVSSPSSKRDKICNLYEKSKHSKVIYGIHLSTWEFNPEITLESLVEGNDANDPSFLRDYAAIPPDSANAFIYSIDEWKGVVDTKLKNLFALKRVNVGKLGKNRRVAAELEVVERDGINVKVLALDAGKTNNSFAIALAHNFQQDGALIPKFLSLNEVIPKDGGIDFSYIYNEVIAPIVEKYQVKLVVCDRWESTKILHDIEMEFGIETKQYSVKYRDFVNFRDDLYDKRMIIPNAELDKGEIMNYSSDKAYPECFLGKPVAHFIMQSLSVVDQFKKTVEKGDGVTDDIFRAVVLAHHFLCDPDYEELLSKRITGLDEKKNAVVGVVNSRVDLMRYTDMSDHQSTLHSQPKNRSKIGIITTRG
jgi:hypothetical protein